MSALPIPVAESTNIDSTVRREMDTRRRLNFEFYDQLDCLDMSSLPDYLSEELEGAD